MDIDTHWIAKQLLRDRDFVVMGDHRAIKDSVRNLVSLVTGDPSLAEDPNFRPIIKALQKLKNFDDAQKIADVLRNVQLPPRGTKPTPSNPLKKFKL